MKPRLLPFIKGKKPAFCSQKMTNFLLPHSSNFLHFFKSKQRTIFVGVHSSWLQWKPFYGRGMIIIYKLNYVQLVVESVISGPEMISKEHNKFLSNFLHCFFVFNFINFLKAHVSQKTNDFYVSSLPPKTMAFSCV